MVFLNNNSPCRETPKKVLKKNQEHFSDGGWVWDLANVRGSVDFFLFFFLAPGRRRLAARRIYTAFGIHAIVARYSRRWVSPKGRQRIFLKATYIWQMTTGH
jgi:hypothetical protein